jgi:hypothetical protein
MLRVRGWLRGLTERGCAILVVLLVTMPLWVMSLAWRGPLYTLAALALLALVVAALSALERWLKK